MNLVLKLRTVWTPLDFDDTSCVRPLVSHEKQCDVLAAKKAIPVPFGGGVKNREIEK